jgi:recombination associated protein RdgC
MGALRGNVTVRRYLVRGERPKDPGRLVKGARAHVLIPIDPRSDAEKVAGWACLEDPEDLELTAEKMFHGPTIGLALRVDTLSPPAAVVKRLVAEKLRATGRKPNRAEKIAAKDEVKKSLRSRYLPVSRAYDLVWQTDTDTAFFWSHAARTNEMAQDLFYKSFGLELVAKGPVFVAGRGAIPVGLAATPEMVVGFPGMPGRVGDDGLDEEVEVDNA